MSGARDAHIERELKCDVGLEVELPAFEGLSVSAPREVELVATYWDTDDFALLYWGCSLRFRTSIPAGAVAATVSADTAGGQTGIDGKWTLKFPAAIADGDLLARHELSVSGSPEEPPEKLLELLHTVVMGTALHPVAVLTTERTILDIAGPDGGPGVQVTDDRVRSEVDGGAGPEFREVEVEMTSELGAETLGQVRRMLEDSGVRPTHKRSKIARVLDMPRARTGSPKRLRRDATVRDFLAATMSASTWQLIVHDPAVRLGADIDAIHQARVATRRLRSDLKTFAPLMSGDTVAQLRGELAWIGAILGDIRDPQVLRLHLDEQAQALGAEAGGSLSCVTEALASRAEFHHGRVVSAMGGDRYRALVAELLWLSNDPPVVSAKLGSKSAERVVGRIVRRQWKRARRAIRSTGPHATDQELHQIRKRLKRVRYAAQSARTLGIGSKAFRRHLAAIQDELGELNDLRTATAYLSADIAHLDPNTAFLVGRLVERIAARSDMIRSEWPDNARRLTRLDLD